LHEATTNGADSFKVYEDVLMPDRCLPIVNIRQRILKHFPYIIKQVKWVREDFHLFDGKMNFNQVRILTVLSYYLMSKYSAFGNGTGGKMT